jgi:hypothetical protein
MNNDFIGNEFHKARRHDLMKEAEGGQRLKAAGVRRSGPSARALLLRLIGVLLVALFIAQGLAH